MGNCLLWTIGDRLRPIDVQRPEAIAQRSGRANLNMQVIFFRKADRHVVRTS